MPPSFFQRLLAALPRLLAVLAVGMLPVVPPLLYGEMHPWHLLTRYSFTLGALLVAYALTARWVVPGFLLRRRIAAYVLLTAALTLMVIFSDLAIGLRHGPSIPPHRRSGALRRALPPKPRGDMGYRVSLLTATLLVLVARAGAGLLAHTRHDAAQRLRLEQAKSQAEQEKNLAELALLRAQLNPHLFFNTLNSIYFLTDADPERAREAIYRLSRLMRYVLYQSQEPTVLLSQELQFMQDYVDLMRLRLTPNMTVDFRLPASAADYPLAPLLLQPFLENAFKHGVSTDEPATIQIHLWQEADVLHVHVRNRIFTRPGAGLTAGSGIGLTNTRRRLELLYPGRYKLTFGPAPDQQREFEVALRLVLG